MKKSLFITLEFSPQKGGVASYYYQVCKNLPIDSVVVLANKVKGCQEFDQHQNFKIIRNRLFSYLVKPKKIPFLSTIRIFFNVKKIAKIIKENNIELIQVGNVLPLGFLAMMLEKKYGIPYIVYTHGLDVVLPQRIKRKNLILKKVLSEAQNIIANSCFTEKEIIKLGVDQQKIIVVNPGPNITSNDLNYTKLADIKEKFNLDGKKEILSVGRLVARKGFDTTIKAMAKVIKNNQNVVYLIVGGGLDFGRLSKIIDENKLSQFVYIISKVDDQSLAAYYQLCDIFVMPAKQIDWDFEGFGIVYLEANSFGKPVIGAKSGGVPEAIIDNQTGLLVEPDNVDQLVEKINQLLTQNDLAKQLGLQGMQRVINDFDWQKIVDKIKLILN